MKAVVFASGSGTNFEALMEAQKRGDLDVDIVALFCDKPGVRVFERANRWNIPSMCIQLKECENKTDYETRILRWLEEYDPDLIILSGYMKIVGPTILERYGGRIVNLHPALLPRFPGAHAILDAYEAKVPVTGVTVHYIDENVDTGPVILQQEVPVDPAWSLGELESAVHAAEYQTFYKGVNMAAAALAKELEQE
ncbi:phosphoribosylglycinamide formyltransferase [Allobaculum mucilyticum]|uniref:phosphoribosylglycinamide formyltransferase n=1 Tax=Allobaculum mucilyticum TaxID=2834459 RepID=UPI001E2F805A|nr:phosphoribosylglycinamide formyltransferase [Allobaculum mucilyticum]UNT96483.1 phosphoribosylglycinamide formyltransferase [Allobaculum mucilyticum]